MLAGLQEPSAERTLFATGAAAMAAGIGLAAADVVSWLALAFAALAVGTVTWLGITLLRRTSRTLRADFAAVDRANRELERRLGERTSNLKEASDEILRLAEVIERDLRPSLSNVMGFTGEIEALRSHLVGHVPKAVDPDLVDPATRSLHQDFDGALWFIRSSVSKMDRLVGAIVDLAEIGRRELKAEIVDLDRLVRRLAADVSHRTEKGGIRLAVGKLPPIVSDGGAIEQILMHLLDNAAKFLRDVPGHIAITAKETESGMVEISVADNGRGIAAADQARIFDLFRRSGATDRPGEGVGLAVARTLVRRLGGTIRVESELDRGSTFTVALPKTRAP